MNYYVAPHLRNKNLEVQNKNLHDKIDFPTLGNLKLNLNNKNEEKSFAEILNKNKNDETQNVSDKIKEGWSIITVNKNKIIIKDSDKTIEHKKQLENTKKLRENRTYFKNLDKMIDNWNNFRDNENDLRGDLSPYINYINDIENMKLENLKIEKEIEELEEYNRQLLLNNESDDDESNRHLIY
tara:strand:- start:674 stop:1222 length:549 start_codon:yes stop_codon:yes gene_type:complete